MEAESDGVIDDFGDFAPRMEFLEFGMYSFINLALEWKKTGKHQASHAAEMKIDLKNTKWVTDMYWKMDGTQSFEDFIWLVVTQMTPGRRYGYPDDTWEEIRIMISMKEKCATSKEEACIL
nr:shikimate O-hydroxycinnamoyltransferase-like [Tanacetum cinerariifolium]